MRSYIFTKKEREVIKSFLAGATPSSDLLISQIRHRVKHFVDLSKDVEVYLKLRRMFEQ